MIETELFESDFYISQIEDIFSSSFILNPDEISLKLDIFNRRNSPAVSLKFGEFYEEVENLSLFEKSEFYRDLTVENKKYRLSLRFNSEIPLDIDKILEFLCRLIEEKIILEDSQYTFTEEDEGDAGIWVLDALGNIIYKNKTADLILRLSEYQFSLKGDPQIYCVGDEFFLVIPSPDYEANNFTFYSFLISEQIINNCAETALKNMSLETSILAHDLKNPLTAIKFGAELLKVEKDIEVNIIADELLKEVKKCEQLIEVFLGFYKKKSSFIKSEFELDKVLLRVKKMLGNRGEPLHFNIKGGTRLNLSYNEPLIILTFYIFLSEALVFHQRNANVQNNSHNHIVVDIDMDANKNVYKLSGDSLAYFSKKLILGPKWVFLKSLFKLNGLSLRVEKGSFKVGVFC